MSITHDYIAQELHHERAGRYERDVVAARLVKPVVHRPRSRSGRQPWWHGLRSAGSTA
ncbi:MAG TPA: hypothetical protein VFP03_03250 [Jiangellaceae bacterium]|jgi:hypothetical protein|nr:hypothetical protein [Jiangellaceae bacterium]